MSRGWCWWGGGGGASTPAVVTAEAQLGSAHALTITAGHGPGSAEETDLQLTIPSDGTYMIWAVANGFARIYGTGSGIQSYGRVFASIGEVGGAIVGGPAVTVAAPHGLSGDELIDYGSGTSTLVRQLSAGDEIHLYANMDFWPSDFSNGQIWLNAQIDTAWLGYHRLGD